MDHHCLCSCQKILRSREILFFTNTEEQKVHLFFCRSFDALVSTQNAYIQSDVVTIHLQSQICKKKYAEDELELLSFYTVCISRLRNDAKTKHIAF
jgi:hypothetical protein